MSTINEDPKNYLSQQDVYQSTNLEYCSYNSNDIFKKAYIINDPNKHLELVRINLMK